MLAFGQTRYSRREIPGVDFGGRNVSVQHMRKTLLSILLAVNLPATEGTLELKPRTVAVAEPDNLVAKDSSS